MGLLGSGRLLALPLPSPNVGWSVQDTGDPKDHQTPVQGCAADDNCGKTARRTWTCTCPSPCPGSQAQRVPTPGQTCAGAPTPLPGRERPHSPSQTRGDAGLDPTSSPPQVIAVEMRATERKAAVRAGHSHPGAAGRRPPGPPPPFLGRITHFLSGTNMATAFTFPPFPLELTKGICGLRLWAPGGRRTGGDVTPEVRFPPQAQNGPPVVNPLRGEP